MKIKFLSIAILSFTTIFCWGQKGVVSGHIGDKITGEDAIGANVLIEGTTVGSATDVSGNFSFPIDAGTYKLIITSIGYQRMVIEDLVVNNGEEVKLTLQLLTDNQQLEEVVVKGAADKTSESVLLMERKNSVEIVQNIGSQELSRKGISDVEAAVTQVAGVSKQEGIKNVFVRGLGDRYNSTSLNGLPLPSEDPQYKNIALSFFSTDIIDNIGVNKTFTSNIDGDVTGANINIISKKLFEQHEFSISGSLGANTNVLSNEFYRADGNNFYGTVNKNIPITDLDKYTFTNSLSPNLLDGSQLNSSLSLNGGRSFYLGSGTLKFFMVAAMNSDYFYKEGISAQTNTVGQYRQDFKYKKYEYNVSQFALGNLTYDFGNNNSITYNLIYIHDNKQYNAEYRGFSLNAVDDPTEPNAYDALVTRQQTNNNSLFVNQITSEFNLSDKLLLDVRGSFNMIRGDEPDRRQNWLIGDGAGENYVAVNSSPAFNHRFFSTLLEDEIAANAALAYKLKGESKIVAGYNFRGTSRDFDYVQFNFDHLGAQQVDPKNPDAFYNQQSLDNGDFNLETSRGTNDEALEPFFYTGDRRINSGFVHFVYDVNSKLSVILGSRLQNFYQKVTWSVGADEIQSDIPGDNTVTTNKNYFLPSLNLKYSMTDNDQLRFSSSRTFTFPQFKEVAPFLYEDITGNTFGNPDLISSENINLDLKLEHYFGEDGLIAFSVFYKFIKNSINRVLANSAALEYSYYNTGNANVIGGELEFRRRLFNLSAAPNAGYLSSGVNISYLYAVQSLNGGLQFSPTNAESGLEGASPLLINTDVTFTKNSTKGNKITSAAVLNYFSDRIYSLGTVGQSDIMERGIVTIDLVSKFELNHRLTLSLNFKNLLDPEYRQTKEVIDTGEKQVLHTYKKGVTSSIGFAYKL